MLLCPLASPSSSEDVLIAVLVRPNVGQVLLARVQALAARRLPVLLEPDHTLTAADRGRAPAAELCSRRRRCLRVVIQVGKSAFSAVRQRSENVVLLVEVVVA